MTNIEETVAELKIEIKVLQKLVGIMMDSVADARLASKTADKALAMAQEALVVVTSSSQAQQYQDPMEDKGWNPNMTPNFKIKAPNTPTDEELSKVFNSQEDNQIEDTDEPN